MAHFINLFKFVKPHRHPHLVCTHAPRLRLGSSCGLAVPPPFETIPLIPIRIKGWLTCRGGVSHKLSCVSFLTKWLFFLYRYLESKARCLSHSATTRSEVCMGDTPWEVPLGSWIISTTLKSTNMVCFDSHQFFCLKSIKLLNRNNMYY